MNKKLATEILDALEITFPNAKPELNFSTNYELLIAVMLSAQCTDKRVNMVTKELFKKYNTPQTMLELSQEELAEKIKPCGLNNSKAKHILSASKDIICRFNGQVPSTFKDLKSLAGVGQKTANVVFSVAFGGDAIAVDTHVFRVSNRLGIANGATPSKTEEQLKRAIPKSDWSKAHHWLIFHGRQVCKAQKPNCENCTLNEECKHYKNKNKQ